MCTPIHISEDFHVCGHSPVDVLLLAIAGHLSGTVKVSDANMFAVKGWLIKHAEKFTSDYYLEIFQKDTSGLMAVVGKSKDGEVVLWHKGLPWPSCLAS